MAGLSVRAGGLICGWAVACGNPGASGKSGAEHPETTAPKPIPVAARSLEASDPNPPAPPVDSATPPAPADLATGGTGSRFQGGLETVPAAPPAVGARTRTLGLTRGVGDEADRQLALGDAALERDQYPEAINYYRQARRLIPRHPAPLVGLTLARLGTAQIPLEYAIAPKDSRVAELLKLLETALALDADYPPAVLQYGRLLLIAGKAEAALVYLERALTLSPSDAEAHSARAVAGLALGDKAAALRGFQTAAELEPNNFERITNLGTALMLHGDVQQAITAFQRAVSLQPNDPRAQGNLGTALLATGNARGALPHLTRAHELAATRATFMSNLGYAYQQLGQLPTALDWYQRALAADPKLGSAWINLGTAYAAVGETQKAEAAFAKALEIDPTDPRAQANLEELRQGAASPSVR